MKRCPACQAIYEDRIDFCFEDGSPLEEHDSKSDPTALPSGLDAPERPAAANPAAEVKKPRGRGMFARPSVADMLSLPEPGVVPPAGGRRVATPATPVAETPPAEPAPPKTPPASAAVAVPDVADASDYIDPEAETLIYDRDTLSTEISEPEDAASDLPGIGHAAFDEDSNEFDEAAVDLPFESAAPSIDVPSSLIDVPVSAEAVEVPDAEESFEDSFDAPPGLEEQTAVSLDDSWFGTEEDADLPGFGDEHDAVDSIEDPGFADVAQSGEVGFDDSSWSATGATQAGSSEGGSKKIVLGVVGVLVAAAVLAGVMLMPSDEPSSVAEAPAVQSAPVPQPAPKVLPPPPEEPVEPDAGEEVVDAEEAAEELPDAEEVKPEAPEVDTERDVPVVVPAVVEREKAKKPDPKPAVETAKAAKAAKAASPKVAKAAKAATVAPQTPWTGASTTAAPATKPAASANPWGAPVETASRGRMTITTEPLGAMVYVDGRRIGKSPTRTEVTYGTHKVRVELNDYKASSRVVNVQVAEVAVPFRLETATMMGRCNLLGPMGSSVSMDGRSVGKVPTTVSCSPGTHRFTVTPKDGAPFTVSKKIVIAGPGESVAVQLFPG